MIQNILGILVGSIVTLIILLIGKATTMEQYVTALIIGGIANFLWPLIIGFWLARRARARRNDRIEAEVSRQVNEQTKR
jgi:Na+/H+ antiporter NhaD/arsenite permease-like protein